MEYSKKEKKLLRNLVNLAYERELSFELEKLELSFLRFKNKEINAFELDNIIHKYHDGTSREIFKRYNTDSRMIDISVAFAFKKGFIKKEEVDESLIERIEGIVDTFYS